MRSLHRGILAGLIVSAPAWVLFGRYAFAGLDVAPAAPDLSAYATAQSVTAIQSQMPAAGSTAPPATGTDSVTGSSVAYARADHTHATSVQRATMTISPAGQPVRWTFAKPYDAGVVPVVTCTAQNAAGATRPFVVNLVGDATSTYVDLIVFQAAQPTVSLLGASVTLFGSASSGTKVGCQAAKPTQP